MPDVPGRPTWQIVQAIAGIYCAVVGTIAYFYPRSQSHAAQPSGGGSAINLSGLILIGLVCLGVAIAVPGLQKVWRWWRRAPAPVSVPEAGGWSLVIHQALYGAQSVREVDVTEILKGQKRDALAIWVGNNTFGCNPVENGFNTLRVDYSYQGQFRTATRQERNLLVLPEDQWDKKTINLLQEQLEACKRTLNQPVAPVTMDPQRLTVRITNGFVARRQNEWSTMLLLLDVKVDGPPAEVTEWRLHLNYERAARGAFHIPIEPTKMRLEYCPTGDRNVHRADPMPKAVPDRGWILFSVQQASDELFDHVFGGTFVLNAVEHDGRTSTLKQPPEFWLHRADIIQWSELGD